MINTDDLRDDDTKMVKKDWPLTLWCEPELGAMIEALRTAHGEKPAAEALRRILRKGIPLEDEELHKQDQKKNTTRKS